MEEVLDSRWNPYNKEEPEDRGGRGSQPWSLACQGKRLTLLSGSDEGWGLRRSCEASPSATAEGRSASIGLQPSDLGSDVLFFQARGAD